MQKKKTSNDYSTKFCISVDKELYKEAKAYAKRKKISIGRLFKVAVILFMLKEKSLANWEKWEDYILPFTPEDF